MTNPEQQLADMADALIRQERDIMELQERLAGARKEAIGEAVSVLQAARDLEGRERAIALVRALLADPRQA